MPTPCSEASQLIHQARAGCNEALGTLLDGYRAYLLRIANDRVDSQLRPRMPPSDIVQGSLLVATREFRQFRGNTDSELRAWLVRIVTTQLVDGMRRFVKAEKRRANREVAGGDSVLKGISDGSDSPSKLVSLEEDASRLLEAIQSLPDEVRNVVQARYLEGLTFPQIAERLDLPVTTCRRRWLVAVESIGQTMAGDG